MSFHQPGDLALFYAENWMGESSLVGYSDRPESIQDIPDKRILNKSLCVILEKSGIDRLYKVLLSSGEVVWVRSRHLTNITRPSTRVRVDMVEG